MTSPLRLDLDTAQFDKLVADARALIPQLAPTWTDQNLHDPGIMLLELAAWTADQQIYALSRDRLDERRAYAAAMGVRPDGPQPAQGLLWPRTDPAEPNPPWPNGARLPQGTAVSLAGREGPGFVLAAAITLTTARIDGLVAEAAAGAAQGFPAQPPPGGILPFGAAASRGARFRVQVVGDLLAAGAAGDLVLALGVETDCPAIEDSRARLSASVQSGAADVPTPILRDDTRALGQSGVLLLDVRALAAQPRTGRATITLSLDAPRRPLPAKVTRIALNVLPVRQETKAHIDAKGAGLPGQEIVLPAGTRFGPGRAAPVVVRLTGGAEDEAWTERDDLATAGPTDRVFQFDPAGGVVRFGNGLNGAMPAFDADMRVSVVACEGARGLIPAGTAWTVDHVPAAFWNPQPTTDGGDPADLVGLRRTSRERARDLRPIVTDGDLAAAALAARDLRVRRAQVLSGYEPDTCRRLAGAGRTLVVLGPDAGADGAEPPAWLDILRRRVRPRLTLGDRVRVVGPAYVRVPLRATVTPGSGVSPAQLRAAIDAELARRLRLIPRHPGDPAWSLGLDLHAHDVAGWLRRVAGVAGVSDVSVGAAPGRSAHVPAHGLPVLVRQAGDIKIGDPP